VVAARVLAHIRSPEPRILTSLSLSMRVGRSVPAKWLSGLAFVDSRHHRRRWRGGNGGARLPWIPQQTLLRAEPTRRLRPRLHNLQGKAGAAELLEHKVRTMQADSRAQASYLITSLQPVESKLNSPVIDYMVTPACNQTKVTVSLPFRDLITLQNGEPNTL
jgi:hypothetical protein